MAETAPSPTHYANKIPLNPSHQATLRNNLLAKRLVSSDRQATFNHFVSFLSTGILLSFTLLHGAFDGFILIPAINYSRTERVKAVLFSNVKFHYTIVF